MGLGLCHLCKHLSYLYVKPGAFEQVRIGEMSFQKNSPLASKSSEISCANIKIQTELCPSQACLW